MGVQILEKLIPVQGESKQNFGGRMLEREDFWIQELGTVWPYGLNDRVRGVGNVSSGFVSINSTMSHFNSSGRRRCSHGQRKGNEYGLYDHVLTGDLSFFKNGELKNLIRKGPKFREPSKIVWSRKKEIVFDAKYAAAWAKREGVSKWVLHDWTESVKSVINH